MPNQKTRRTRAIPDKLYDLITLPDGRDYTTFRDTAFYPQFSGASYDSFKWPDLPYGVNPNDIIKVNVYGNSGGLIATSYLTHEQIQSFIGSDIPEQPAVVAINPGDILRGLGFRRGRFQVTFDFLRVQAGSPFPLLVNKDEKIYKGSFETDQEDGYVYASEDHADSNTVSGAKLYVKENKFIIQDISSDRTELIISPAYINDEDYLEGFRLAAFNCLNWFPPEGMTVQFDNAESQYLLFNTEEDLPSSFVNGTIRINNAYFAGKRIIPEERELLEVEPDVEIEIQRPNLMGDKTLDSLYGWTTHGVWPNANGVVSSNSAPNNRGMRIESVEESSPAGQLAVKVILANPVNVASGYLEEVGRTIGAMINVNNGFCCEGHQLSMDIEGLTMTASVWVKAPDGSKIRLMAHSGAWGITGNTKYSPIEFATGEWQRLVLTFYLINTSDNKIQIRILWDARPAGIDPTSASSMGEYYLAAGCQLELGSTVTKFKRNTTLQHEETTEVAINNILKFNDPDGQLISCNFADGEERFNERMIGGVLKVTDAIAIDDLSQAASYSDAELENIYTWDLQEADGPEGQPGGLQHSWDSALHGQAIKVTTPGGKEMWQDGYHSWNADQRYSHSGTVNHGYHCHWRSGKGVDGGVAMYFPDLNHQDFIIEPMRENAVEAWSDPNNGYYVKNNNADPRIDGNYPLQNWWKHRGMWMASSDADGTSAMGSLASWGVKPGDTIRVSWMQKSAPLDYANGGRKGASVGLRHYFLEEYTPPAAPIVTDTDVEAEDARMSDMADPFNGGSSFNTANDYFDPDNEANVKPGLNPKDLGVDLNYYSGPTSDEYPDPKPSSFGIKETGARSDGGYWYIKETRAPLGSGKMGTRTWEPNWESGASGNKKDPPVDFEYNESANIWEYTGASINLAVGAQSPGKISKVIMGVRGDIDSSAFGWTWDGNDWISNYVGGGGIFRSLNSEGKLIPRQDFPSRTELEIPGKNISADEVFEWLGEAWSVVPGFNAEPGDDGSVVVKIATWRLESLDSGPQARRYIQCQDYNEWESAAFEVVVPEQWSLLDPFWIYVYGHYGDFGTLYVDQVKLDVIMTSDLRVRIDDTAVLAPLELMIEDVVDSNTVRVTQTYDEAATSQGSVLSNFRVNKYSEFDNGFSVDYISIPSGSEDINVRFEGKILDVINDDPQAKKVYVEKSYQEFGDEIGAVMTGEDAISIADPFETYFIRYLLKDPDNLYTYLITGDDTKSLITNFKPVNTQEYPGSIAYKLLEPLDPDLEKLDMVYIANEVTPSLKETINLVPFIDEKIPDTVLRLPKFDDLDSPIRDRETSYLSHTDLVGAGVAVREQLEDKVLSGSLEDVTINVDYNQFSNFIHFGSAEKRIKNFKYKLSLIETYTNNSASLSGNLLTGSGYLGSATGSDVSASSVDIAKWEMSKRQTINEFDDFENYMYFKSSSYVTSSNGEFYSNASPKYSGAGTLINPYVNESVTSSAFITWFDNQIVTASIYDRRNVNRLVNLLPEHITYDQENNEFVLFMDMMGHHYDNIWTHIKALSDMHDRSEDVTKGISQALVEPVAKSLGFDLKEGRDLVRLPQYHLGLQESGSNTNIYNIRFTKRSQKDVTREIWNRILATMPYMLKSKGTKQSLKALIAAYGIPTSILRIQEYGGPKISGAPDFEIKQRFTKAVDFHGSQYIKAPWYDTSFERSPDTLEFRFKSKQEVDQLLATKIDSNNKIEAAVYLTNVAGVDSRGDVKFVLSGSTNQTATISNQPVYNGEFWSVMVKRRTASISSSYADQSITSNYNPTTQSFDMFLGYYDSGIDDVIVRASASMDISGSAGSGLLQHWNVTSSVAGDNAWYIGGKFDDASKGQQFSGSMMEWRYWGTPLSESAFYNHVAAPKAVNGNNPSSSYYDLSLRFSMDDYLNLHSSQNPYGIRDYSLTDGQLFASASGFDNEINFSNVLDRQKAFVPNIGIGKKSNKIRIENSVLKTPDGAAATLSPNERVEVSSYDLASNDSAKLGIFFAPSDVINEDIILSVADLDYGSYLGDPRDIYEDSYVYGRFNRIADTYWQKWTTTQGFWDYIKLIKYYDLSLFDHLRKLSPGRAKKNLGLLIEPTILERSKVVIGAPPTVEDLRKEALYDLTVLAKPSSSREYSRGILKSGFETSATASNELEKQIQMDQYANIRVSGSKEFKSGTLSDFVFDVSGSNVLLRTAVTSSVNEKLVSDRIDYETVSSSGFQYGGGSLRSFGDINIDFEDRDYTTASVSTYGGDNIFFEVLPPNITGSRMSRHNEETVLFYSSALSASLYNAHSSSLQRSEYESVYDSHTALFRLAYEGCKEDGSTVPFGNNIAVEITETNPYVVTSTTTGDSYVDTDLSGE